jgi:excisionase family DNA binding protein
MARIAYKPMPDIMNVHQAAEYLGVSSDTLYRYATAGTVPAFKLGNRWRFSKTMIDAWVQTQCSKQSEDQNGSNKSGS